MSHSLPDDLTLIFNRHYEKAWSLLQAVVITEGATIFKPGFWQRWKGRRAISHFQKCLQLVPEHWPTHWGLGKAYQGLGKHAAAFTSFAEAFRLQPQHPDVVREASIAAMDAGQPDLAALYSAAALSINPDDAGLMCNHAINLLVTGDDLGATELIARALAIAPNDLINQHASQLIQAVTSGLKKGLRGKLLISLRLASHTTKPRRGGVSAVKPDEQNSRAPAGQHSLERGLPCWGFSVGLLSLRWRDADSQSPRYLRGRNAR